MQIRTGGLTALAISAAALAFGASPALAAHTLTVGNPITCHGATFPTIQSAVLAANSGDHIVVCPGTYQEQVVIPAGKNNLSLSSQKPFQAVIQAPAVLVGSKTILNVNGAQNASISGFTIEGPGAGGCDSLEYGVRVDGGGSAAIVYNHITHIRDEPFSGCQNGVAVQIGRASESTTGSASIRFNLIDDYQKNGITVSNTGSKADIEFNDIRGAGPTAIIAQNGVQVSDGADATVAANAISGNVYSPQTTSSTGILLFAPHSANVASNVLKANDTGVYAYQTDARTTVSGNNVSGSSFDGITFDSVTQSLMKGNTSSKNAEGIGVYASTGAKVSGNNANQNTTDGVFTDTDTSQNTFDQNSAQGNSGLDCEDVSTGTGTAGTANTWTHDVGATSNPTGICQPPKGHKPGHGHGHGHFPRWWFPFHYKG
jgi:parallel beta-helix repeat protein